MKSYLIVMITTICIAFVAMMSLAWIGVYACFKCDVLQFQESKIALAPDVQTVILGDSSVGYGLDAKTFSELSHEKTLNLALTGFNYGIAGAYVLLTEVVSHARPKNVLIVLSAQTLSVAMSKLKGRPIRGFIQASRRRPDLLFTVNREISWQVSKELGVELFDKQFLMDGIEYLDGKRFTLPGEFLKFDYLEPGTDVLKIVKTSTMSLEPQPPHDYDAFFEKVARLCKKSGLNCIYMHGPLMQAVAEQSEGMIQKLNAQIEHAGIKVVPQSPIQIPDEDLGNTINHIRPALQQAYTKKIYELAAPFLR